jgi:hypothetical protein
MQIKLFDPRKIKKVILPSFLESVVEMYDSLLTGELEVVSKIEGDYDKGIQILCFLIKSWEFVDEQGVVLPVSKENLNKLPAPDYMVLMDEATNSLSFLEKTKRKN